MSLFTNNLELSRYVVAGRGAQARGRLVPSEEGSLSAAYRSVFATSARCLARRRVASSPVPPTHRQDGQPAGPIAPRNVGRENSKIYEIAQFLFTLYGKGACISQCQV